MWGGKQKLYENILKFRTHTTQIRAWVEREQEGPSADEDHAMIQLYIHNHRPEIDNQDLLATAEQLAKQFRRISAIEVMNGSMTAGVLIYPRWP
jgi:hypothetical protein